MKRDIRENGSAETRLLLRCGTAVPTPCQIHPLGVTNTTACYRRKLYIRQTEQSAQRPWKVIVRSNHRSRATPEGAPGRDKKTAENLGIFAVGPPPPRRSCRRGGGARGREGRRGRPTSRQDRSWRFPGGTVSAGAGRATVPQSRPLSAGLADHTSDGSTAAGTAAKSDGMTPPRPSRATTRGGWVAARRPWQSLREGCSMRVYSRIAFRYTLILASTTHPVAYLYSRQMKVEHSSHTFSVSCEYTHKNIVELSLITWHFMAPES